MPIRSFEKTLTCPYDPLHQILPGRMQVHLCRCRKQHPQQALAMATCPFNETHRMPQAEMGLHVEQCTFKKIVEEQLYRTKADQDDDKEKDANHHHSHGRGGRHGRGPAHSDVFSLGGQTGGTGGRRTPVPHYGDSFSGPYDEDWDRPGRSGQSYNPLQQTEDRPILRAARGATKAERRVFREQERQRHQRLIQEEQEKKNESENKKDNSAAQTAAVAHTLGKLRLPKQQTPSATNGADKAVPGTVVETGTGDQGTAGGVPGTAVNGEVTRPRKTATYAQSVRSSSTTASALGVGRGSRPPGASPTPSPCHAPPASWRRPSKIGAPGSDGSGSIVGLGRGYVGVGVGRGRGAGAMASSRPGGGASSPSAAVVGVARGAPSLAGSDGQSSRISGLGRGSQQNWIQRRFQVKEELMQEIERKEKK